jgi:DNA-binding CsgD family transcriptional regulator
VIGANADGKKMLRRCLSLLNGRLSTAHNCNDTRDLDSLVQRALGRDVGVRTIDIVRNCEQTPYLVEIVRIAPLAGNGGLGAAPVHSDAVGSATKPCQGENVAPNPETVPASSVHALVSISELVNNGVAVAPELLVSWLKLSCGEARLAVEISRGRGPREAAARVGLTEASARVILKRVFAKAGVSSQPQLVALISRLSGMPS